MSLPKNRLLSYEGKKREVFALALDEEARQRNMTNGGCLKWSDIAWECFIIGFENLQIINKEIEERGSK